VNVFEEGGTLLRIEQLVIGFGQRVAIGELTRLRVLPVDLSSRFCGFGCQ